MFPTLLTVFYLVILFAVAPICFFFAWNHKKFEFKTIEILIFSFDWYSCFFCLSHSVEIGINTNLFENYSGIWSRKMKCSGNG